MLDKESAIAWCKTEEDSFYKNVLLYLTNDFIYTIDKNRRRFTWKHMHIALTT